MKQISFCLVFANQNNSKLISNLLLNLGIVSYIESIEKACETIETKNIDFLFIDFDFANKESFSLLEKIKNKENLSSLHIIGTSFLSNEKFIKETEKYNILAFITKPITKAIITEKINNIFQKYENHYSQRKHIRIKPDPNELLRISFRLKNKKFVSAKIIDISLGGLAALFYTNFESNELYNGNLIEHVKFEVDNKEVDADTKIITKKSNLISLKFTHFYNESDRFLIKYITKKMAI